MIEIGELIEAGTKIEEIRFAKRLGEKRNNADSPRPLLIGFKANTARISILDNAHKLANEDNWRNVNVVHDLTQMQRKEEEGLRKEADRLTGQLSESDAKNWLHKVVGRRGERRLVRVRVEVEEGREHASSRGGNPRGRGGTRRGR